MRAVQIEEFGGPEVLKLVDLPVPEPGEGELLVKVERAGLNFADTHQRENSYLAKYELPLVIGGEVAGTDPDGRRVISLLRSGGYAEYAAARADQTFPIPDGVDDGAALALLIQGLTAWHLYRTSARLAEGESVVVHAAAGGVGSLAVQLGKALGAGRVIATASSVDSTDILDGLGADAAVDVTREDLKDALREANDGRRVDIVLEMTGGNVFDGSMSALAPFGRLVAYGMAGRVPPKPVQAPSLMGTSRAVIGFWLAHCMTRPEMMDEAMNDLLAMVAEGSLKPVGGGRYPLSAVREAHQDLLARRTTGKLVLDPSR